MFQTFEDLVSLCCLLCFQNLPVILSLGVALTSAILLTYWFTKKKSRPITLVDSTAKVSLKLSHTFELSHDTKKFRFALPSENHILGEVTFKAVLYRVKKLCWV